jgi:serine/threonine protein kinase/Tol biopolymer transport system component
MALPRGTRFGPYEILDLIGAGGMGEVYKARDTRLDRTVAIKVLPADHRADLDRRRRFEREAQAIAALAHPHICVLHDVGREQDVDFLVMEYLEGETLATRLLRGPLPLDDVLRYGTQIGDALDKAHRRGIVHRDLKPGNVMLTKGGIKLLDFGVARLRLAVAGDLSTATAPESLTSTEAIVGTLPYVAPEQLEGASGDARSDIFALGAVLYEMASGKRAFGADSAGGIIAAILNRKPEPLVTLQPTVPASFDRLVGKCLAKDPNERWQSASDVADELRWIGDGPDARELISSGSKRRTILVAALASAALLAGVGGVFWQSGSTIGNRAKEAQHQQVTFVGDVVSSALSPDGRTVAYATQGQGADTQVVVQDIGGDRRSIAWRGRQILSLSWMPDGSRLVVVGDREARGVWIVPLLGGMARQVSDVGKFAAASPDGTALALTLDTLAGFAVLPLAGGARQTVNMTGFRWVLAIAWHARTNRIVLMTGDEEEKVWTIWSVAADGREPSRLLTSSDYLRAMCTSPVSDVVYAMRERRGTLELLRVPMYADPTNVRVLQSGLPITRMGYRCTVSTDGRRLLYGRNERSAKLWRLNLAPSAAAPAPLTSAPGLFWFPDVSPDGAWVAASEGTEVRSDLVKISMATGDPVRLGEGAGPVWSSDGQQLAFTSRRSGSLRVWIAGANGQSPKEVHDSAAGGPRPIWLADGRLAWQTPDRQNYRIRDLATGRDEYLFTDSVKTFVSDLVFSPNGDHIAMRKYDEESGLWVMSWPGRQVRALAWHTTPFGWSADGEWIYAVSYPGPAIVRVSSKTGAQQRIEHFPVPLQANVCDVTPKRDAIVCGIVDEKSDAWMMQDFDRDVR